METRQITIWDNISLEQGTQCLSGMEFDKAESHFLTAMKSGSAEPDNVRKLMEACQYWRQRIQTSNEPEYTAEMFEELLSDYNNYPFTRSMAGLKKSLLTFIIRQLRNLPAAGIALFEAVFDFCIKSKEYSQAEDLVFTINLQHPNNRVSLYLLAQAQWLQGNFSEANRNYTIGLLRHPDTCPLNKIENRKLKDIILALGPESAPAFGFIRRILPLMPGEEKIMVRNEIHQKAIECYRLLCRAHEAMNNNDMKNYVNFRKQLKLLFPELYTEYFKVLKTKKGTVA